MCGHVGIAGNLYAKHTAAFRDMLYMDALRGPHGTGIASIPWAKTQRTLQNLEVMKMPSPAWEALNNTAFKEAASNASKGLLIGHNRHATKGAHTYQNTHPFKQGTIIGAHNGTVSDHNRDLDVEGEFGTDSEEIFASIDQNGLKETISKLTVGTYGAWALVWYDVETNELNMLRNAERPLTYAFNKDRSILMWASEPSMMRAAAQRRGIELDKTYSLPVDTHFIWALPAAGEVFGKEVRTKCAGKKPRATVVTRQAGVTSTGGGSRSTGTTVGGTKNYRPFDGRDSSIALPSTFDKVLTSYAGFTNETVVNLFRKANECVWCGCKVTVEDVQSGRAVAISRNSFVCEEHKKLPLIHEVVHGRQKREAHKEKSKAV